MALHGEERLIVDVRGDVFRTRPRLNQQLEQAGALPDLLQFLLPFFLVLVEVSVGNVLEEMVDEPPNQFSGDRLVIVLQSNSVTDPLPNLAAADFGRGRVFHLPVEDENALTVFPALNEEDADGYVVGQTCSGHSAAWQSQQVLDRDLTWHFVSEHLPLIRLTLKLQVIALLFTYVRRTKSAFKRGAL